MGQSSTAVGAGVPKEVSRAFERGYLLCVWAKENTFFFNVLRFFSNFVCVLITVELKHMQKGRFQNIEEHF